MNRPERLAGNLTRIKKAALEKVANGTDSKRLVLPTLEQGRGRLFRQFDKFWLNVLFAFVWIGFGLALLMSQKARAPKKKAFAFFLSLSFGLLALAIGSARIYREYWLDKSVRAVVVQPDTIAYRGPGATYPKVVQFVDGATIEILGQDKNWYLVKLGDGRNAWLDDAAVKPLPKIDL